MRDAACRATLCAAPDGRTTRRGGRGHGDGDGVASSASPTLIGGTRGEGGRARAEGEREAEPEIGNRIKEPPL